MQEQDLAHSTLLLRIDLLVFHTILWREFQTRHESYQLYLEDKY